MSRRVEGSSFPLGPTPGAGGVNFSVFAKHATAVQLLLFDRVDAATPARVIDLDPRTQRTYHYWHAFVPGVTTGQLYAYRVAWAVRSGTGTSLRPRQGAPGPVREMRGPACRLEPRRRIRPGGQLCHGVEERRCRSGYLRLGRGSSSAHAVWPDGGLRDARRRLYPPPRVRRRWPQDAAPLPG